MESVRGNQSLFTDLVVDKDLFHCASFIVSQGVGGGRGVSEECNNGNQAQGLRINSSVSKYIL